MNEEDIIDIAEKIANFGWSDYDDFETNKQAIQGLLYLYNKEKEKNKELQEGLKNQKHNYQKAMKETIHISKIIEKIKYIEENYSEHSEFNIGKSIEFLQELLEERN